MKHLPHALAAQFLSCGRLRAAIDLGNPILASEPAPGRAPIGVSVDLATEFARRLGAPLELVCFDAAAKAAQALAEGQVQLAFLARDPACTEALRFSPAYARIEGGHPVPAKSSVQANDEHERPGQPVVAGKQSAYHLFLSRTLQPAQVARAPASVMVIEQAMAIRRSSGAAAACLLSAFVEEMKQSGFVARALYRHQIHGATVAPPADQLQGAMS